MSEKIATIVLRTLIKKNSLRWQRFNHDQGSFNVGMHRLQICDDPVSNILSDGSLSIHKLRKSHMIINHTLQHSC